MNRFRRNLMALALGALALAILAGIAFSTFAQSTGVSAAPAAQATTTAPPATTAASTAKAGDKGQQALDNFSKIFASKLNVDEAKLNSAFSEAVSDTADQAVKDGTLSQTQANFIKDLTKNGIKGLMSNLPKVGSNGAGFGGMAGFAGMGGAAGTNGFAGMTNFAGKNVQELGQYLMPIVTAVSKALNLSPMDILAQLQADKSLADIAQAQKVDLQTVKDAITNSIKTQLEAAVKASKLTQAQADKANQTVATWLDEVVNFKKSAMPANTSSKDLEQYFTPVVTAVADSLKLTVDQLKSELKSGKSLGDIAKAQTVDLQKVKDAITSSSKTQLDAAAKAGKITQSQADKLYQTLTTWIDDVVK